jgi:2-polyprenyl-3-methyl-5-hydroxy-6-metoxy-1,4-benzoquinol methylase
MSMADNTLSWHDRFNKSLREQHDLLFENGMLKEKFAEYTPCPVCDQEQSTPFYTKDGFVYIRCSACSMVYMNPRLNQAATYAFYNSNVNAIYNETKFDTVSASTMLDDQINFANLDLISQYREGRPGKILEIGCGKGYFLAKAKERGYQPYGVELNEKNCQKAQTSLGDTVYNNDIFDIRFENELFDVIYMRDVIEHIHNPKPFLAELSRIAKPGALLYIETHNINALIHRIVREKHTVIFGFEHPTHWSPKTLGIALKPNGFKVKKVIHESLDFTIWHIIGYFSEPTFTTIYPWSISKRRKLFLKILRLPYMFSVVRRLDSIIVPRIANWVKCGSVMKVIALKQ